MNKYNARYVYADGYVFGSKAEHRRWCELKLLLTAGEITDLMVHPKFPIKVGKAKICDVVLDFSYRPLNPSRPFRHIYEDVKGWDNTTSKIKRKLLKACYPEMNIVLLWCVGNKFEEEKV